MKKSLTHEDYSLNKATIWRICLPTDKKPFAYSAFDTMGQY